ncbi:Uncharacterised protein [Vibrio cholerae]|nr:Uncharacterised protein [Vibrio cholerae]
MNPRVAVVNRSFRSAQAQTDDPSQTHRHGLKPHRVQCRYRRF